MVTRAELYEAVWAEPMIKLAERFEVSGSYLARVCDSLRVPRPDRGYWAKKEAGKTPPRPSLPPIEQGEPTEWSSGNGVLIRRSGPQQKSQAQQGERKKTHTLLQGAAAHFAHSRMVEDGEYLKPYKRYLVDITASQLGLQQALEFANTLFFALEEKGHHVRIFGGQDGALRRPAVDPLDCKTARSGHNPHYGLWSPGRLTVTHVNGQMVGLSIVELAEATVMRYVGNGTYVREVVYVAPRSGYRADSTWTTTKERPAGRLRLTAYAPHHRVELTKQWQQTDRSSLTTRVPNIVGEIEVMAAQMVDLVAKAELQVEAERRRRQAEWRCYAIEENKRRIRESTKESREQLDLVIRNWAEMRARLDFLKGLEQDIDALPEPDRTAIKARIALARDLLGPSDPVAHFRAWSAPTELYMPKNLEEDGAAE
jgi:hypothetical protein